MTWPPCKRRGLRIHGKTSRASRRAVISKSALRIPAGRSGVSLTEVARIYRAELEAKLASGCTIGDPVHLHEADL
ncbi:hypothetical protein [Sphingomonas oryzagri]